ncbi:alpha/beta fold hydrolase [Leptospira sp. GIMC2001]|uniref:alpha/beta fold hydrolase n=1 Tax=Leptospira sp. GIMC2001 TaxID=1513297 RepID=UPI00234A7F81|nr:alpha/beta hydrolase [Leptospira sp. GIMC2001]WCL49821.1 alpha/beta hydrolase [Leptospira sp. GIMC2001]
MKKVLGFHEKFIDLGGHSVFFLERDGNPTLPTLVLVHGFLDLSYGYRKLLDHLPYEGRILIPDHPGYGFSRLPKVSYLYQIDVIANILYRSLEKTFTTEMILCGHSMGGLISQKMVLLDQKLNKNNGIFKKLILLATGGVPHPNRDEMKEILFPKNDSDIRHLLTHLYHAEFPQPSWLSRKILLATWNGIENQFLAENTIRREKEIFFGDRAKEIKLPTLIISGDEDELTTPGMMKNYSKWIRKSQLFILPRTKHALHYERSVHVAEIMDKFIKSRK